MANTGEEYTHYPDNNNGEENAQQLDDETPSPANAESTRRDTTTPDDSEVPQGLYNLFYYDVGVEDPVDVVIETCKKLAEAGINTSERLHAAPEDFVRVLFPFQSHARRYAAVTQVKQCQAEWHKQPSGNDTLAEAMLKMAKEQENSQGA